MSGLALVGGNSILGSSYGVDAEAHVVLQRHGSDAYNLPHVIDHAANMQALADAGCDRVLALGSVGSLREELPVGTFLAPDDFIALGPSPSIHHDYRAHRVPGFTPGWRARVIETWAQSSSTPLVGGGVYWQSAGPRFETPAEIRIFAQHAHVVGMTLASECVVAGELGLDYAAICIVDNMANGVGSTPLTLDQFEDGKQANHQRLIEALDAVLPQL
ncbi:MAG: hypothetical protein QOG62_2570 [Thermoleophilaceae bacterium]|nr:hypothetical protein [Thermoleophilaceae bacterium]